MRGCFGCPGSNLYAGSLAPRKPPTSPPIASRVCHRFRPRRVGIPVGNLYQVSMIGTYRNGEGPVIPSWRTPGSPAVGSPHRDLVLTSFLRGPATLTSSDQPGSRTSVADFEMRALLCLL